MATQTFTQEQLQLHAKVRKQILDAEAQRENGERSPRQIYLPENDMQLLEVLVTGDVATRFGSGDTDDKKQICEEVCKTLQAKFNQTRTPDSIYYRISKLLKAEALTEVNYKVKGDKPVKPPRDPNLPPKKRGRKKKDEGAAVTIANPEEPVATKTEVASVPSAPAVAASEVKVEAKVEAKPAAAVAKAPVDDSDFLG